MLKIKTNIVYFSSVLSSHCTEEVPEGMKYICSLLSTFLLEFSYYLLVIVWDTWLQPPVNVFFNDSNPVESFIIKKFSKLPRSTFTVSYTLIIQILEDHPTYKRKSLCKHFHFCLKIMLRLNQRFKCFPIGEWLKTEWFCNCYALK